MVGELDLSVKGKQCYSSSFQLYSKSLLRLKANQNGSDGQHTSIPHNNQDVTPTTPRKHDRKQAQSNGSSTNGDVYKPRLTLPSHQEPTYFIGGGNGVAILEEIMNDLGWRRIKEKTDDTYTMKWAELKQTINYNTFREGDQLANHIPNCNLLTNKLGLLNSLQEYSRACIVTKKRVPKLDFIPETFRVEDPKEREYLKDIWREGDVWICKPTGRNQGKGIFLVKNRAELDQLYHEPQEKHDPSIEKPTRPMNRIIQRYLHNPLLLKNKKFDIRAYMLVACSVPYLVLYHKGYIRLSMFEYENKFDNLAMHLTNQFIQKKDPMYKEMKEDTLWSMEKFNDYVNEHVAKDKDLEQDWVQNVLPVKMKNIMTYCFNAVKHRLQCKVGYFDLYGFDFMIDDKMKVWLIEVNVNPTLATNCESLKEVIPPMVKETLYLAIECFDKARKNKSLAPIQSLDKFEVIYNGCQKSIKSAYNLVRAPPSSSQTRPRSLSPLRRSRTISPVKEPMAASYNPETSQPRRAVLTVRTGLKPPPTSTSFSGNRISTTLGGSAQQSNSTTKPGSTAAQSLQRSPYFTDKNSGVKSGSKLSGEKYSVKGTVNSQLGGRTGRMSSHKQERDKAKSQKIIVIVSDQGKSQTTETPNAQNGTSDETLGFLVENLEGVSEDTLNSDTKQDEIQSNQPEHEESQKSDGLTVTDQGKLHTSSKENTKVALLNHTQKGASPKFIKTDPKSTQGPSQSQKRDSRYSLATSSTKATSYDKPISSSKSPYGKQPQISFPRSHPTEKQSPSKFSPTTKPKFDNANNNNSFKPPRIEPKTHKSSTSMGVSLRMTHSEYESKLKTNAYKGKTQENRGS